MNDTHILKQYNTQLSKIEADISVLKSELKIKNEELDSKKRSLKNLHLKIQELKTSKKLIISEHALLRYFERVLGFNLEDIQGKILTDSVSSLIEKLGTNSGQYPVKEGGFSIVIKDRTVVTIV